MAGQKKKTPKKTAKKTASKAKDTKAIAKPVGTASVADMVRDGVKGKATDAAIFATLFRVLTAFLPESGKRSDRYSGAATTNRTYILQEVRKLDAIRKTHRAGFDTEAGRNAMAKEASKGNATVEAAAELVNRTGTIGSWFRWIGTLSAAKADGFLNAIESEDVGAVASLRTSYRDRTGKTARKTPAKKKTGGVEKMAKEALALQLAKHEPDDVAWIFAECVAKGVLLAWETETHEYK